MQQFIALGIGLLVPLAVSALKRRAWPDGAKVALSLLVCALAGAAVAYGAGDLTWGAWAANAGLVFTSATTVYKTFFQATPLNATLEQLPVLP